MRRIMLLALMLASVGCAARTKPSNVLVHVLGGPAHLVGDSVHIRAELVQKDTLLVVRKGFGIDSLRFPLGGSFLWKSSDYSVASLGLTGGYVRFDKPGRARICAQTHFIYAVKNGLHEVLGYAPFPDECRELIVKAKP